VVSLFAVVLLVPPVVCYTHVPTYKSLKVVGPAFVNITDNYIVHVPQNR